MLLFTLNKAQLFSRLKTGEGGLTEQIAARRLEEFGPNRLEAAQRKNYPVEYLRQYVQFFALLLEAAAALAFVADHFAPGEGSDVLGWAILGAVVINASFTFWQEYRADKAMEALLRLMPTRVTVRRGHKTQSIDAAGLVPGDLVLLDEGDKVAADGVLLENNELHLNLSALTGESRPSARALDPAGAGRTLEARNMVFAGATVVSGNALAVVTATGHATEFGRIAGMTRNVQKTLTPMQREIIRITRILTVIAVFMGMIFFVLGLLSGRGALMASVFALSLIVANVPEGLLPTITLSLSLASRRMARRNALIKHLDSVETLGSATVICTDKTGTLTRNEMTLKELWLAGGETVRFSGEGYLAPGKYTIDNPNAGAEDRLKRLLLVGRTDCRAVIDGREVRGDPTELAIVACAAKLGIVADAGVKTGEIPFSGERKRMSTLVREQEQSRIFTKGAVETVLALCTACADGNGATRPLDTAGRSRVTERAAAFERQAYRVLAVAEGRGIEERNLSLLGLLAIMDLPRDEVREAIGKCREAGIRVMMITGDNPVTAAAVADLIGMQYHRVITGPELEKMDDRTLEDTLQEQTPLFARMASGQKLRIAGALQALGEVVAMTGDGVNDAPALKRADIGIAMGRSGTEVAREAADMVLLDDNFSSIVAAVEEGRTVWFNIKKFVTYILSSNVPEIVPYILQFFLKIPLPLSVIQILSIDLGSDLLPGLALGSEGPEKHIMRRPPVGRREKILDWEVFKRGYFFIGLIEAAAAMAAFLSFLLLAGWQYGQVELADPLLHRQAMTMTLLGAVSCQLFNAWTLRSYEFPALGMGLFSNKLMLAAMAAELTWVALLLTWQPMQALFNTAYIPLGELGILLPFPLLLFFSHERYKRRGLAKARKQPVTPARPVG
jgi:sodium/potassium-transporting ATPase subunit alpha